MLYFALGVIVGMLVNPFRKDAGKAVTTIKNAFQTHASFVEPKNDISVTSLKDYIHD